jgi:hypothetical protein
VTVAALPSPIDIQVRDVAAVDAYIRHYPGVADLIRESSAEIHHIFGFDAGLVLDIPPDYEEDDVAHLYVRIHTPLEIDDALDRLDRFNDEWWWDRMGSAPDTLHFTIE